MRAKQLVDSATVQKLHLAGPSSAIFRCLQESCGEAHELRALWLSKPESTLSFPSAFQDVSRNFLADLSMKILTDLFEGQRENTTCNFFILKIRIEH